MDQRKIIFVSSGAALILAIFLGVFFFTGWRPFSPRGAPETEVPQKKSATWSIAPVTIAVPEKGDSAPQNIAIPQVVGAAAPAVKASYRGFTVTGDGGKFAPDTVIVRKNDTVRITVAAVDQTYDVTQPDYGIHLSVPKGETKWTEFEATAVGKFTFYCAACGGPDAGPIGYLIVAAP